jgi:hypothetical protein
MRFPHIFLSADKSPHIFLSENKKKTRPLNTPNFESARSNHTSKKTILKAGSENIEITLDNECF